MQSVLRYFSFLSAVLLVSMTALPGFSQVVLLPIVTNGAGLASGSGSSICTSSLDSVGDGCPATEASIGASPQYLWGDSYGNIYIGDYANYRIRVIFHGGAPVQALIATANPTLVGTPQIGYIYSIAGGPTSALGSATESCDGSSGAHATDKAGNGCPASSAFLHPYAGDSDAAGDVFFTDRALGTQVRVIYAGGSAAAKLIQLETGVTSPVVGSVYLVGGSAAGSNGYSGDGALATAATFDASHSVSVDANENLYVADTTNNVVRMISGTTGIVSPLAGGAGGGCTAGKAGSCTAAYAGDGGTATQASLNGPYDAIADSFGNIFISDAGNQRVRVIYAGGTLPGISDPTAGSIYTLSGGGTATASGATALNLKYSNLRDVSLDPAGNIYVTDTTSWRVWKIDRSTGIAETLIGGGKNQPAGSYCSTSQTTGLKALDAVADGCPGTQITFKPLSRYIFDQNGVAYVTDYNNALIRAATVRPQFPDTAYGSSSTISLVETYSSTFKAPDLKVGTQGSSSSDFSGAAETCVPGTSYSANTVCTYTLTFSPTSPGARAGYYNVVTAGTTTVLSSGPIGGTGIAPLLGMTPSATSTLAATYASAPQSVSVDETGNLYISDTSSGSLLKGAASGGTFSAVATGLSQPSQSAVDGFGNLYIADMGNNRLVEVTPAGETSTFASGLSAPRGVAAAKNGALYIADSGSNRVLEYVDGGQRVLPLEGLDTPAALALDGSGNLYIADSGNQRIVEFSALQVQSTVATGTTATPVGLAADAAGNLYFADAASDSLWQAMAGSPAATAFRQGLNTVGGIALDASGNLFFTQTGVAGVGELSMSTGSLSLATASSTQALTLENIGNSNLNFLNSPAYTASGDTTRFSITDDTCTGAVLPASGTCKLNESYVSSADESDTETLTFLSNALNAGSAEALIAGGKPLVSSQLSLVVSTPATGPIGFGQAVTFTVTIIPTAVTTTPTGTLVVQVDGATYTTVPVSGLTVSFSNTFAVGPHVVSVTYSGDQAYATSRASDTVTVTKTAANIQLSSTSTTVGYGGTEILKAVVSSATSGTPTGTVTFFAGTASLGTAALSGGQAVLSAASTAVGAASVTAVYNGDDNFNTATSNTIAVTTLDADFTIASDTTEQAILPQGFATYTLTLTPASPATTLTSATNFTVSGLPPGASYTFSPASIAAGSAATITSLVVLAPKTQATLQRDAGAQGPGNPGKPLTFAFLMLPLGLLLRSRGGKALRSLVLALAMAAVLMTANGCGNSSGYFAQAPKTYNVTVTATSGTAVHSINVALKVQ